MSARKVLIPVGLVVIPVMLLTLLLWALPAGATHKAGVKGTLSVFPVAVSPDVAIAAVDRTIIVTLIDPNINSPLFVGTGPNGEVANAAVSGVNGASLDSGDRISIGAGGVAIDTLMANPGVYLVAMNANPIGAGDSTPLADRDDDGDIDINDLEIVDNDCDGDDEVDLTVASILDHTRGLIYVSNVASCMGTFTGFGIRYATPGVELTRTIDTIVENLVVPDSPTLVVGESFTHNLALPLKDTDGSGTVNSGDVTIRTGAGDLSKTAFSIPGGAASLTMTASGDMNSGDVVALQYMGDQVVTVPGIVDSGDNIELVALTNSAVVGGLGGIQVISGNVTPFAITGAGVTAAFTATQALTTGDTFTIRYTGTETLAVPATGFFYNAALATGEQFTLTLNIDKLPLQDTNGDSVISTADIIATIAKRTPGQTPIITNIGASNVLADESRGLAGGSVINLLHTGDTLAAGTTIVISYKGLEDLVTVQGSFGEIPLRLMETGPDTGVFTGDVIAVDIGVLVNDVHGDNLAPGLPSRPQLAVSDAASIRFSYKDRNPGLTVTDGGRVNVENDPPDFQQTSPASGDITNELNTVLSTVVSDLIAGVDAAKDTSIVVTITVDGIPELISSGDVTVTETPAGSGVYSVSYNINTISRIATAITDGTVVDVEVVWSISASDTAGNRTSTELRPLQVNNAPPDVVQVIIGQGWDTETASATASRTSIRVDFNTAMDAASFQAGDFLVGGVAPTSVAGPFVGAANSVFLTVPELAPDATPSVDLVGEVLDVGGNSVSSASVAAPNDGIAPGLTVNLTSDTTVAVVSTSKVTMTVSSDELIVGAFPVLTFDRCGPSDPLVCTGGAAAPTLVRQIVTEQKAWSFEISGLTSGDYNLGITVQDAAGNVATAGTSVGDPRAANAHHFEIDTALPAATVTPADGATQAEAALFLITVNWAAEGAEYPGDTQANATLTTAVLDTGDAAERNLITLASANVGGNVWSIAIPDITLGEHTLSIGGTDAAGNVQAVTTTSFTVTERPLYAVALQPGLNLVSLPAAPASTAIDDVITSAHDVTLVFTYDPNDPLGPWLFARRDRKEDPFKGDLTTIDSKHAYFMSANAVVDLSVDIPVQSPVLFVPPTIVVRTGWNLVPVTDITQKPFLTEIAANTYFGATGWARALGYNSLAAGSPWVPVAPGGMVQVGFGYWVWFNAPGLIIP